MQRHGIHRRARWGVAWLAVLMGVLPGSLFASTKGKISGQVTDKQKRPVVAVTVAVVGQPLGAFTNAQGQYNIGNVPSGTYEVKISRVGYKAVIVQNVIVSADNTTRLDAALQETTITTETVVVTAEQPPVEVNLTSSRATLDSKAIEALPVQELQDIVNLQAGVVDGHFRGGRLGEVQYQVDGVSVNNAYDNLSSLRLDRSVLKEVQVISGTFDAEYGQAMSGVVNAVLKDGGDRFGWTGEILNGGFVFPGRSDVRGVDDTFQPTAVQNYTVTVDGPVGLPKTNYLVNLRRYSRDEYIIAERLFLPEPTYNEELVQLIPTLGDRATTPLGYSQEWSGAFKLSNTSVRATKLSYQALFNLTDSQRMNYAFRYEPDGMSKQQTNSIAHGFDMTRTLSPTTFLDLSLRQNYRNYEDHVYDDVYDPRYDAAGPPVVPANVPGVYVWGVDFTRFEQMTNTYLVKTTLVSQINQEQQIKTGIELQLPQVEFGTPGHLVYTIVDGELMLTRQIDNPPDWPAVQTYWPVIAAGYFQDQVEWSDFTLRAGGRLDYFDARATVPSDPANPANAISGAPQSVPQRTTPKLAFAPRLGVAYPITDQAGVHFAYGHFYQFPPIGTIFTNADYSLLARLQAGVASPYGVMGNPDVEPEQSIQYEFGYKQAFGRDFGFEATAFYKDIRYLLGTEFISTYNDAEYARLTNVDFGSVIGVTVAVDHRRLGPASLALDYTWQVAQGNSSDPRETATRAEAGEDPRPRVVPFNWDQRHTFNMTLAFENPGVYIASGVLRVASGQPYTPEVNLGGYGADLNTNSGRKPLSAVVDLRAERNFRQRGTRWSVFGRVFNVFDTRFFNGAVFPSTGDPYYSRIPQEVALADPTRLYPPRRIELGFTLSGGLP